MVDTDVVTPPCATIHVYAVFPRWWYPQGCLTPTYQRTHPSFSKRNTWHLG